MKKLYLGDVEIDIESRVVCKAGTPVNLTVKEYDLLMELMQNKNVALYRERLYENVEVKIWSQGWNCR